MLRVSVPPRSEPIPVEIAAFARPVASKLAALGMLNTARWLTLPLAAYALPTRIPFLLPLLLGALLEPVRLAVLVGVRRKLRRACLCAFADAALDAPGGQGTSTGSAWRAAYVTERAVAVDLPSVLAAGVTTVVLLALSVSRLGWGVVIATVGMLAVGAGIAWLASRQRRPLYAKLVAAMRRVSAWMDAASADQGEIQPMRSRGPFLQNVELSSDAWSRAEARLEQRRLVARFSLGAVVLVGFAVFALGGSSSAEWLRLEQMALGRVADLVVLASVLPSAFLVARYADAWVGANNELAELRPRAVPRPIGRAWANGRSERLRIEGLELRYDNALGVRVSQLDVPLVGHLGIVGRNGSGKSTLASVIAGVLVPTSGRAELDGVATHELDRDEIAFVPQEPVVVEQLTVAENVRLVAPAAGDPAIAALLGRLGLTVALDARAETLSRGEQRRIALARALLVRPRLLVLDEPDAWLDTEGRGQLIELLAEASEHAAIVLVTHRAEIADSVANVIVLGDDQELDTVGPLQQVRADSLLYRRVVGGA